MNRNSTALRNLFPAVPQDSGSVVEIGSSTLKFHSSHMGWVRTIKYPYNLGQEVYATGEISQRTERAIVEATRDYGLPSFAIATSAVRDAKSCDSLKRRLHEELGLELQVLSCYEECSLLVRAYREQVGRAPALVTDIGGGSVKTVFLNNMTSMLWDCLPIGVIRLCQKWKLAGTSALNSWLENRLRKAAICPAPEIFATGGAVKTIARVLQTNTFSYGDVVDLEAHVCRAGSSFNSSPNPGRDLFPDTLLIKKLMSAVRARRMHYVKLSVGRRALQERLRAFGSKVRCSTVLRDGFSCN